MAVMDYTADTKEARDLDRAHDLAAQDCDYCERWWRELRDAGLKALIAIKGIKGAAMDEYLMVSGDARFGIEDIEEAVEWMAHLDVERTYTTVLDPLAENKRQAGEL